MSCVDLQRMGNVMRRTVGSLTSAIGLAIATSAAAQPLAKSSTADGSASVTVGVLSQPAIDWEQTGDGNATTSVYVRRLRLIGGATLTRRLRLFVDSDTPNLGRDVGGKRQRTTYLQDLIVTYAQRDELLIDAGLLMVPVSYNSVQSAASLLAIAYSPYSFVSSAPMTAKVGRDQGVQARGYLAGKHLEYRVGAFRGIRQIDADAPLRTPVRLAWHAFEPQTGFFYTGTTHGRQRLLSVGASLDRQGDYSSKAIDVFYETPAHGGNVWTVQADVVRYDGGTALRQIPLQDTLFVESGYTWNRRRVGVFGQAAWQQLETGADSASWQLGATWWARGHRANVKAGIGRTNRELAPARTQLLVQTQVFAF
jgi:hypothetical protein